jgi:hypothetical protein
MSLLNKKITVASFILVFFFAPIYAGAQSMLEGPGSGLVAWWKFDEPSGLIANDSSGNGNNGILLNFSQAQRVTGFNGTALSFNGTDNYIDAGNISGINSNQGVTISAWIKPLGKGPSNYLSILQKVGSFEAFVREDQIAVIYLAGIKNWVTNSEAKKDLFDKTWHHFITTYNGALQRIFIDGVLIDSIATTGNIAASAENTKIGVGFKGEMDNVRLYNRGLSQEEALALHSSYGPQRNGRRTYYLSSSTGNDSNDGLSELTPWKTLSKIYESASIPNTFIPGDNILLKKGDSWEGQIKVDYLGKTGAEPILIGAYGPESEPKPIIYGDGRNLSWRPVPGYSGVYETNLGVGSSLATAAIYENSAPYINSKTPRSLVPGSWGQPDGRTDIVWVSTANGSLPSALRVFRYPTIRITHSNNVIVENLSLKETWTGVYVDSSDAITVRNIDTVNTQDSSIYFNSATNSVMDMVSAINSGNTVLYIFEGSNNTIKNSTVKDVFNTISGIYTPLSDNAGIGLQQSRGNIVEYNKISNVISGALDYFYEADSIVRYNYVVNANGFYPHGTNNIVYGNIFNGNGTHAAFNASGSAAAPNYILNNTFYNVGSYGMMASSGVVIRNNIMYGSSGVSLTSFTDTPSARVDSDYNLFYTTAPYVNAPHFVVNNVLYQSFLAYQQATGHDAHSLYADPKFVTSSPVIPSDFSIQVSSPGIDKAQLVAVTKDYAKTSIPQGLSPDIGAFEFPVLSNLKAEAPRNLRIVSP